MTKQWTNFWLAVAMLANGACLALTGSVLRWAAPGGPGRGAGEGGFLWRSRHDWRDLHFHLALLFVSLIAIHLLLHWEWIARRLRELGKSQ